MKIYKDENGKVIIDGEHKTKIIIMEDTIIDSDFPVLMKNFHIEKESISKVKFSKVIFSKN